MDVEGEFPRPVASPVQLDPRADARGLRAPIVLGPFGFAPQLSPEQYEARDEGTHRAHGLKDVRCGIDPVATQDAVSRRP